MIGNIPSFDPNQFATKGDLENRPIYDDSALRDQITSIGQRPEYDDTSIRDMITSIQQGQGQQETPPGYDDAALREMIAKLQEQISGIGSVAPPPATRAPTRVSGIESMVSPSVLRGRVGRN